MDPIYIYDPAENGQEVGPHIFIYSDPNLPSMIVEGEDVAAKIAELDEAGHLCFRVLGDYVWCYGMDEESDYSEVLTVAQMRGLTGRAALARVADVVEVDQDEDKADVYAEPYDPHNLAHVVLVAERDAAHLQVGSR